MDQFRTLWEGEFRGGLPVIFNFMNNQYGMGGQTQGETMGYDILARVGAGVNPEMMHAERVDGYNPLAVIDAFKRKKKYWKTKRPGIAGYPDLPVFGTFTFRCIFIQVKRGT
jgi:2-oxoisovalerate dehydrogenase E1 component